MKPTYIKFFNFEIMIEPTNNSSFTYVKESAAERELQLGKVRVIISKVKSTTTKLAIQRF